MTGSGEKCQKTFRSYLLQQNFAFFCNMPGCFFNAEYSVNYFIRNHFQICSLEIN